MDSYSLVLIIHLLCAIFFIGFIFTDIFVFPVLLKTFSQKEVQDIKKSIGGRGIKIFPLMVLVLLITGTMMFSKYINAELGYFESTFQYLLWLKVFLVFLIASGIVYSLFCKVTKRVPFSFMEHFHKFAFVLTVLIVIIAKLMFVV